MAVTKDSAVDRGLERMVSEGGVGYLNSVAVGMLG